MVGKRGLELRTSIDAANVKPGEHVDLCGIVQNLQPRTKVVAGDLWQVTFKLIDDDKNSVICKIFRPLDELLVFKEGQIVFLKNMQVSSIFCVIVSDSFSYGTLLLPIRARYKAPLPLLIRHRTDLDTTW